MDYKDDDFWLMKGDCLERMKEIPSGSVDMVLCDLPYGTTACKWDSILDLTLLWEEYKRLVKYRGYVILTAQTPFDKVLGCSNLSWLKYEWIWRKTKPTGHLNANFAPLKEHENILVFTEDSTSFSKRVPINGYRPQGVYEDIKVVSRTNKHLLYRDSEKSTTVKKLGGYPKSVLDFKHDNKGVHPTQNPSR